MENLSLFELDSPDRQQGGEPYLITLDIVKMDFVNVESMTWKELFSGFDNLYAITYSSGIGFIYQLLDLFESAEIIFGCDEVLSGSLQEVMAYQSQLVNRMKEIAGAMKTNLVSRIENKRLHLYVTRNVISHEKIYLLSAEDGRKRVVLGSANMSFSAFEGYQRESICYLDGDKAYDWYWERYADLKGKCVDRIEKDMLLSDDILDIEKIPVVGTVKTQKAIVLTPAKEMDEEIKFILDVNGLTEKFKSIVPKKDKKGKWLVTPEDIKVMQQKIKSTQRKEKELRKEYPQLEVYPDEGIVKLNDNILELSPGVEEISKDVQLFQTYMQGFEKFHGDSVDMQRRYFEFANWFFCSPFMAYMRDVAVRFEYGFFSYPVFGLLYGQSKAGKTSFLETLLKMMIGQKTKMAAPEFTRTNIEALKRRVKGAPIIVDDLTNTRFNQHAIETIKNDDFGVADCLVHYPAVVISANTDIKAVAPEIIRRTIICRVQAGLTNTEVMQSNVVRKVQKEIGTALYREYMRQMLEIVPNMAEQIKVEEQESTPDILAASSKVLVDIFQRYGSTPLPEYIRCLTLDDYFNEKVTGCHAIKMIQKAWEVNRSSFEVNEKANELIYYAGTIWEAKDLLKELPETLEASKPGDCIVMNLKEARNYFGVPFKKSFLDRWRR